MMRTGTRVTVVASTYGNHDGLSGTVVPEPPEITTSRHFGDLAGTVWVKLDIQDERAVACGYDASQIARICTGCEQVPADGDLVPWSGERLCWNCADAQLDLLAKAVSDLPVTVGRGVTTPGHVQTLDAGFRLLSGERHRHEFQSQALVHSHEDGSQPHGYFGHPEDPPEDSGPDYLSEGLAEDATREARP